MTQNPFFLLLWYWEISFLHWSVIAHWKQSSQQVSGFRVIDGKTIAGSECTADWGSTIDHWDMWQRGAAMPRSRGVMVTEGLYCSPHPSCVVLGLDANCKKKPTCDWTFRRYGQSDMGQFSPASCTFPCFCEARRVRMMPQQNTEGQGN